MTAKVTPEALMPPLSVSELAQLRIDMETIRRFVAAVYVRGAKYNVPPPQVVTGDTWRRAMDDELAALERRLREE